MSITENRQYFLNGNSILKDDYAEIREAKTKLDSNINYPSQNFDNTLNNPMNYSNGNVLYPKDFQKNDNSEYQNNENDKDKKSQTFTPGLKVTKRSEQNFQMTQTMNTQNIKYLENEVEKLYDYYYMFKGYFQNDASELFNFYLDFKKRYNKGIKIPNRIEGLMKYKEEDVDTCIRNFLINVRNRFKNNSEYGGSTTLNSKYKRSMSAMKGYDNNNIKNDHNIKFTKDTLKRLYPRQEEIEKRNEEKLNCDNFHEFFKKLLKLYKKQNKRYTNDKDEIINFWKNIDNKEDKRMQWEDGEMDFIENIELFFNDEEIIQRLSNIYYHYNKMRTYHATILHNYWEHNLTSEIRYLNGLNKYNKDDFFQLLDNNYKQMLSKKNLEIDYEKEGERKRKKQEEIEYRNYLKETREELQKKFDELSKPKDRYKTGRVMLKLQDQFKYDNIIKKMIKIEFKDNKLFKFPEEYAIRDEDEQKDILFKLGLNKWELNKNSDDRIEEQVKEAYDNYQEKKSKMDAKREKRAKLKKELFDFIEKKVKEYFINMNKRLTKDENGIESINLFLNTMYKEMSQKYKTATRLYFKRPRYEILKKAYRYKKNHTFYPKKLKYYFFRLLRHIGKDNHGNLKIDKKDNCPFWSPSLSNNCKVHGNNCPIYCCHNTHNDLIKESREKNFNTNFNIGKNKKKLKDSETLNLWKRPDLMKQKEQIFMCFDDAQHCTFEPKLSKNLEDKDKIIQARINNKKWIEDMGPLFTATRATIYKEGILKVAKIHFSKGEYDETLKILEKGFNIDEILKYKEGNSNNKIQRFQNNKKDEEKKEDNNIKLEDNNNNNILINTNIKQIEQSNFNINKKNNKDNYIPYENFTSDKNKQLIEEVYFMYKTIREYIRKQNSQIKKLDKEINLYNEEKKLNTNTTVNTKNINIRNQQKNEEIKKKYFNIKSHMCPKGDSCPYYLNGESDLCPEGAHQIYELKFKSQIRENIKLQKELMTSLEKNPDPKIKEKWVPSGALYTCKLAEGLEGKCHCGFCKYRAKNYSKTNEAMKKRNIKKNKKLVENYEKRKKKEEEKYNKKK